MTDIVLITGGAGFVGSNLATYFKQDLPTVRVIVVDNLKRRGSELSLRRLAAAGVEFIHADIRATEDLEQIQAADLVIDCAAEPSVLAGYGGTPSYIINTNVTGTVNTLEVARRCKADVIFLSTSRVYPMEVIRSLRYQEQATRLVLDNQQEVRGVSSAGISEEFSLVGTRSLYGASKLAGELIAQEYAEMFGFNIFVNRCGVISGPWQMGKVDQGVVVLWVARHYFGGRLSYIGYGGEGKQVRDMLHVRDLYDLLRLQLSEPQVHRGRIYNVGGGAETSISMRELTTHCEEATGNRIEIASDPVTRSGDIPWYVSDASVVRGAARWAPKFTVRDTINDIVDWIRKNEDELRPILN